MEYLFIYLLQMSDLLRFIKILFCISIIIGVLVYFMFLSWSFDVSHGYKRDKEMGIYFKDLAENTKKIVICLLVILFTFNLLPTKQTLLLMGGTYLGKKAVNAVVTNEKIKKVDTIINLQLDKYIKELQTNNN